MAVEYITTNQTTIYTVDSSDQVILVEGVYVNELQAVDTAAADITLLIDGNIYSSGVVQGAAVDFYWGQTSVSNVKIMIGTNASILSAKDGLIFEDTTNLDIVNDGSITVSEQAIYIDAGEISLTNAGSITSLGNSPAVQLLSGETNGYRDIVNTGQIIGGASNAIQNSGGDLSIMNSGTIGSQLGRIAIDSANCDSNDIFNSGTILGDLYLQAVFGNSLVNLGTIGGSIEMIGPESSIVNRGIIDGAIEFSSFDDTFKAFHDALQGAVNGGGGNDVLLGGNSDDEFIGGSENDVLRGRQGDDDLLGGAGNDVIVGGAGDDTLNGGSGQDVLTGATGDDTMKGGGGSDRFVFGLKSGDDVIEDFQDNIDKIDLRAYGIANTAELNAAGAIQAATGGSIIDLRLVGGDGTIFVEGMNVGDWNNADFLF